MQRCPVGGYQEHYYTEEVTEEFANKDDYHYGGGSTLQMKPTKHFNLKPEHGYGHHNAHGYEHDTYHNNLNDRSDAYGTQYSAIRYEKEQYTEPWNRRHDYPVHGGKHYNSYQYQGSGPPYSMGGGYAGGGSGGHYGGKSHHHHGYGEEKSFWKHKGIQD